MKKAVYITCLIFSLVFLGENINFMYAQLDDEINGVQTEENLDTDLNNSDNELQQEECIEDFTEEYIEENENIGGNYVEESNENKQNMDDLDIEEYSDGTYSFSSENREINVYDVEQVTQEIDTSEYGIIRIADPSNPGKGITIHDRNLGAETIGYGRTDDTNSYGYYYQWGNNYGFPYTGASKKQNEQVNTSSYGPNNPYSSDTFIKGNNDWSSETNENLWGGTGDDIDNELGYPIINATERKGPCPDGYHVPSIGEWSKLIEFWAYEYTGAGNELKLKKNYLNLNSFSDLSAEEEFLNNFKIPVSSKLNENGNFTNNKTVAIWTSSSKIDTAFRALRNSDGFFATATTNKSHGLSVRCFYNSYRLPVIITYDINGGYWYGTENGDSMVITYTKADDEADFIPDIELGIPKKLSNCGENGDKKCMFAGRYTLTGDELWTGNLSGDITVYAKWLPVEDTDIFLSGVNFTIMDRNLGAMYSGTGEKSYGHYLTGGENNIVCPDGYHIPSTGEWKGIGNLLGSDFDGNYIRDLLNLPFAGKFINNEIVGTGDVAYYLAKDRDNIMYAEINDSSIEIKNLEEGEKVSVRCFKDYNTGTIKFNTDGGNDIDDILAVNWREEGEDLETPERENSIFSGWYTTFNFQEGTKIGKNINYKNEEQINAYAKWNCVEGYKENENQCEAIYFNIKWIDGNGNTLKTESIKRGSMPIYSGVTPIKNSDSDYNYTFNGKWLPEIILATGDAEYIAQFDAESIKKSGGSSSGGGRGKSAKDNTHGSADSLITGKDLNKNFNTGNVDIILIDYSNTEPPLNNVLGKNIVNFSSDDKYFSNDQSTGGDNESIDAYIFAKNHGIITDNSIKESKMYSPITRIEMAKILSNYAINILGKEPNISKGIIKFNDVTNKLNSEYDNAVTKGYQLGIIGQNITNNNFRPNDKVTRAEFATVLSRLLYGTEDGKGNVKYYEPHMVKLYNEGIINSINPKLIEKKGYIMIMLMRNYKQK